MSYVSGVSAGSIPCVVAGCLATRAVTSPMCVTHRGASGAPRSSKPKRSSQPAAAPADKGDDRRDDDDDDKRSKTTRPRTVRYLSQTRVDAEMSLATDTRRLSADDSDSALAKFLAEQRQAQAPRVPTLVRKQQDRLR